MNQESGLRARERQRERGAPADRAPLPWEGVEQ